VEVFAQRKETQKCREVFLGFQEEKTSQQEEPGSEGVAPDLDR